MDFSAMVETVSQLLLAHQPEVFNSSWIRKHTPRCYRFIRKNLRGEFGAIDWDLLTCALDRKFQRRWTPARRKKNPVPYEGHAEVEAVLEKYRDKLYVFLTSLDKHDRQTRDMIGIRFVRLAQNGNLLARQTLMSLIRYTIDEWIERDYLLSRWRGHENEIQKQIEACIRRYRYTGSFATYLFRTLQCAGRGIRAPRYCSLDKVSSGNIVSSRFEVLVPHLP